MDTAGLWVPTQPPPGPAERHPKGLRRPLEGAASTYSYSYSYEDYREEAATAAAAQRAKLAAMASTA